MGGLLVGSNIVELFFSSNFVDEFLRVLARSGGDDASHHGQGERTLTVERAEEKQTAQRAENKRG